MTFNSNYKSEFERDGFLIYDFGLEPELIEACKRVTENLVGKVTRVQDLWRREPSVRELGAHPTILKFLSDLYGREAFPFQTLNFPVGTEQGVHADTIFFDSKPSHFMCGVWVALEDMDMENGPLIYYAQSQKRPIASMQDIRQSPQENIGPFFENEARNYKKTYGLIKKGEAIIWAANVLHGGSPIIDKSRTRFSQVTHYYFKDCAYHTPLLQNKVSGKPHWRAPYDFGSRKFVWGYEEGKMRRPKARRILADITNNVLRRTPSW